MNNDDGAGSVQAPPGTMAPRVTRDARSEAERWNTWQAGAHRQDAWWMRTMRMLWIVVVATTVACSVAGATWEGAGL
jgi:hypothetical protein